MQEASLEDAGATQQIGLRSSPFGISSSKSTTKVKLFKASQDRSLQSPQRSNLLQQQ